jgi:hypothetical protein
MRTIRFICVFAILSRILVLAQSSAAQLKYPTHLPGAKRSGSRLFPSGQGSKLASKASIEGKGRLPPSGLNFAPPVAYSSGGNTAVSVAAADVNLDGKLDIIVANDCGAGCTSGAVGVLLGNGDGTFQTASSFGSGGLYSKSVAIGDVNHDGKPDVVVANWWTSSNSGQGLIGVLLGNGDGTFQNAVSYASGGIQATSVAIGDLNGDGYPDVVLCNGNYGSFDGSVGVLLGNGDGTFRGVVTYDSLGSYAVSVAVADLNADGKLDVVVVNSGDGVGVLLGNGDGTLQSAVLYGMDEANSVAIADVNGDGKPDLIVTGNVGDLGQPFVDVFLGNGDGTFYSVSGYDADGSSSVAVADVNGDGKLDLLVAGGATVDVFLGNGDGTFQGAVSFAEGGTYAYSVAASDVNGDGKPDLLVADAASFVAVLINSSLTTTATTLTSSINPSNFGQSVTFSATVSGGQGFYKGTPTGAVTFFDGTTNIGNSNLNNNGLAMFQTSTLAAGTHSITAMYNGDTDFAPSTSQPLSQVVQGAIAAISPTGLNFGNQTVGIVSGPQAVTLTNTGNIALTASIGITGTNGGDFTQTNNCPSSLPPNASCMVNVTFDPTAIGTRSANLVFTDNAPNSPQLVSLSGVGVVPAVTFSPTSLTFPTQVVYTNSKAQMVTLTNTGLGILKLTGGALSGQFGATTTCNGTLKSGASCNITVTFKPRAKGILNGDISVTDNAPDSPQKLPLTGVGTYVLLSPISVNFGTQPVNTTSQPKYISFTNKGSGTVNFTGAGISITGTDAGDFVETNNCGSSVASGASCKIKVTFTPSAQGTRTASVSISDDGGGSPQTVPLTGIGTP